ncbi:MAG: hypothetical protein MK102_06070 [Fuerstiella sp.]|nr:hypothetical protein [Fuerstiella sp.]
MIHLRAAVCGALQKAVLLFCLLVVPTAAGEPIPTILWRTPVSDTHVCGVSGRTLELPDPEMVPIRAWAGILTDPTGGSFAAELKRQHLHQMAQRVDHWKRELSGDDATSEINRRIQHARRFDPVWFDAVVIQEEGQPALRLFADDDLDGHLEARGTVTSDQTGNSGTASPKDWLRMSLVRIDTTSRVMDAGLPEIPKAAVDAERPGSEAAAQTGKIGQLYGRLKRLDRPSVRKQHLSEIVAVADQLLLEFERRHRTDSVELADLLYRKGRALGYRELPDVIANRPIKNPGQLNLEFEATFARLRSLVDVTRPQYVLLAIRRERRRGYRGAALDLLETCRHNHPHSGWYRKKRSDLLKELKLPLLAHQAAADLWLNGTRPARPIPVIFRMSSKSPVAFDVSWPSLPPWRSQKISLRNVSRAVVEGVAWLPVNSSYEITSPDRIHQRFSTDRELLGAGSIVVLGAIGEFEQ